MSGDGGRPEQVEELEVLNSIYEGDPNFKQIDDITFQYKFGEEGETSTLLIEVKWPPEYPDTAPLFSLQAFYNNHLTSSAKTALLSALNEEAEKNLGEPQTYTVFEWARDNYASVVSPHLVEEVQGKRETGVTAADDRDEKETDAKQTVKKPQLSKSQKRKEWDRVDSKGEKPRGYDWVDVVKHLSQTGGGKKEEDSSDSYLPSAKLPI